MSTDLPARPADPTTVLRAWSPEDAADLLACVERTADLAVQLGGAVPTTVTEAADHIRAHLRHVEPDLTWAVVRGGVVVGNVGLTGIERRHDTAWVSYWLDAEARGRGVAARAVATVAAHAFGLGLVRLELGHRTNNPASCAVAVRAGFLAEGVERAKLRYGTERFDVETHARLATDPAPDLAPLPLRARGPDLVGSRLVVPDGDEIDLPLPDRTAVLRGAAGPDPAGRRGTDGRR